MTITREELDAMKARCERAMTSLRIYRNCEVDSIEAYGGEDGSEDFSDEFAAACERIADAASDLPRLIAEVEELQAEND